MSKIVIEQVDRLDEERKVVRYGDLEVNDCFITSADGAALRMKLPEGHLYQHSNGYFLPISAWHADKEVIPVKAKILWCREDGGGE